MCPVPDTLDVIAGTGIDRKVRKSRVPAWLDLLQSASGLFLVAFLWLHMFFVASILLGKEAMYVAARFFEGYYFFGKSYPIIVSILVAVVFAIFILHAALAMRKFPITYRQYKTFREHRNMLRHADTSLWFVQVYTGFAMFFLGSVHLYIMLTQSDRIGPYASADRVWSEWMWPLYLLLLLAVEFHGAIGLYRLAVKWGWFGGPDADKTRSTLQRVKWGISIFFLTLGLITLAAYIRIGIEHQDRAGERYRPVAVQTDNMNPGTGRT